MINFSRVLLESSLEVYRKETSDGHYVEWSDGTVEYFDKHGSYHRTDGPAISTSFGFEAWYLHGKRHRIGGPAVIAHSGAMVEYWVNGRQMTKSEYNKHFGTVNENSFGLAPQDRSIEKLPDGTVKEETQDSIFYRKNGKLHLEGGPAFIEKVTGRNAWYNDGKLHREDGPAVYYMIGSKMGFPRFWYDNDQFHRIGGPAVEFSAGLSDRDEYWVRGRKFEKDDYEKHF